MAWRSALTQHYEFSLVKTKSERVKTVSTSMPHYVESGTSTLHVWRLRRRQVLQRHWNSGLGHSYLDLATSTRDGTSGSQRSHHDGLGKQAVSVWRPLWKQTSQGLARIRYGDPDVDWALDFWFATKRTSRSHCKSYWQQNLLIRWVWRPRKVF